MAFMAAYHLLSRRVCGTRATSIRLIITRNTARQTAFYARLVCLSTIHSGIRGRFHSDLCEHGSRSRLMLATSVIATGKFDAQCLHCTILQLPYKYTAQAIQ